MRATQSRAVIKAPPMSAVLNMPNYDLERSGPDDWTKTDEERRGYCLKGLERTREAFQEHVTFLFIIREEKLWRKSHDSFQGFCSEELGYDQSYVHKLCGAAEVFRNLLPAPEPAAISANGQLASVQVLPTTESQVRPLKRLEPAEQPVVWSRAVERAGGKVPTAKIVEEEAEKVRPSPKTAEHPAINAEVRFDVATRTLKFGQEVTIAGLQQLFKWGYKEAAEVFDLLVDRYFAKDGKFVAHPNPETQAEDRRVKPGLDADTVVQVLTFRHGLLEAEVHAVPMTSGRWHARYGYKYLTPPGEYRELKGFAPGDLEYSGLALLAGLKELRQTGLVRVSGQCPAKQKVVAKLLVKWCGTEIRKLGDMTEKPARVESRISGELGPELVKSFQSGFGQKVGELARGFIERIQEAMDPDKEASAPLLFEKFGQVRYFLGCALSEARRIERENHAERPEKKGTPEKAEIVKGFVVCRAPLRGVLDKRHRFDTGGGWGNDPRKALLHETLSDARQIARRHKDKVMTLKAAIAIFEKEKK